jgi:hypothetical protein
VIRGTTKQEAQPKNRIEAGEHRPPSFFTRFLDLPRWEQYAAAAAVICLLAWLGASGWTRLFAFGSQGGWFSTLSLIGSVSVIVLSIVGTVTPHEDEEGTKGSGTKGNARQPILITMAMLPALGGAIELLQHFWASVALVAAAGMAFAAYRLFADERDDAH